ncbi:MAG: 30S ribosomal protein S8 [Flavobacteriaceae bacterium]|jgi:small subunit ribosomal protein S8|tara:strand:- start:958 stop:1356 length:399 start_codon:yes stop_codon:yes gene_type:complete
MNTDPIADYLTRVRNAIRANHKVVSIPASNLKKEITKILFDQGYILSYKFEDNSAQGSIKIALKYTKENNESVITNISRISKPGLRKYSNSTDLPRVLNGLGIAIISTSKGVMTAKQARTENVGGEVICYVN